MFNDKIVISCNYKDGTKTVSFSEMEGALTLRASASGSDLDFPGAPKRRESERDSLLFGGPPPAGNDPLRSNSCEGIPNPLPSPPHA